MDLIMDPPYVVNVISQWNVNYLLNILKNQYLRSEMMKYKHKPKPKYEKSDFALPVVRHTLGLKCDCLNCVLSKYEVGQERK